MRRKTTLSAVLFLCLFLAASGTAVLTYAAADPDSAAVLMQGGAGVPFNPNSIWNRPIDPAVSVHPSSEYWMNLLLSQWPDPNNVPIEIDGVRWAWSVPVYYADASTPRYRVCSTDHVSQCEDGVPIPDGFLPSPDGDGKAVVVEVDASPPRAWSFWRISRSDGVNEDWTVDYGAYGWTPIDQSGDGLTHYGGGFWGGRATGWNYYAGLIRPEEIAQGHIDHALVIIIPNVVVSGSPVWPARGGDGSSTDSNAIPLGVRFQLDPSINVDELPLSPGGRVIARALQTYGAWLGDSGSTIGLNAQEFLTLNEAGEVVVDGSPWSGLLSGEDLYSFPTNRLRIVNVNPDEFYRAQ